MWFSFQETKAPTALFEQDWRFEFSPDTFDLDGQRFTRLDGECIVRREDYSIHTVERQSVFGNVLENEFT